MKTNSTTKYVINTLSLEEAIVAQAAKDYKSWKEKLLRDPKSIEASIGLREVTTFFKSTWYKELTTVDPQWLMQTIDEEIEAEQKDKTKNKN